MLLNLILIPINTACIFITDNKHVKAINLIAVIINMIVVSEGI
jgi:hypothetical protein